MIRNFNDFYKLGTTIKLKASLYTIGILFFVCICNLFLGSTSVNIFNIFEIFIVSFIVAIIEFACFYNYDDLDKRTQNRNTAVWALLANILFISSAFIFNWFVGITPWAAFLLLFILEAGLIALRYSIYVITKADTKNLNEGLKKFQNKN
ncbi:hypothetical protein UT300003_24180 [Clostridium sardiniense]